MAHVSHIVGHATYYPDRNGVLVAGTVTNNGVPSIGVAVVVKGDWGERTTVKTTVNGSFGAGLAAKTNVRGRTVNCWVTRQVQVDVRVG